MNTTRVQGAAAELRWGYYVAATLRAWRVSGTPGAWTFTATIVSKYDFRLSQQPLDVVTPNGWRWSVSMLQIAGTTLTASVSPKESLHAVPVCAT